jgi:hypothetical protein
MAELQSKAAQQKLHKSSSKTLALPPSHVSQSFGDDLESLFYVFAYVCIKYSGPNGRKHQESVPDSLLDSWLNLNLDTCKLRKVYFFAVSMEEAHLERQFHPYFTKLIPLAKEWRAILRDNMETWVTFDGVIELLEHHLATLQDDEERSTTTKDLKKAAEELTHCINKCTAEAGWSIAVSSPKLAKQKKHEAGVSGSDSDTLVTHVTVESEGSDNIYDFD